MEPRLGDPWQLVIDGRFPEAVEAFSQAYEQTHALPYLRGRAKAYLLLRDYTSALRDTEIVMAAEDERLRNDDDYIFQGICYWYLRDPLHTILSWKAGLTAPYTDAAGGVIVPALLLYAAERLSDATLRREALALLRKHARRKLGTWPGPVVPFLLAKIDDDALDGAVSQAGHPLLFARWRCQADFYVALRAFREGKMGLFRDRMAKAAASSYGYLEVEYYLAQWEVQHHFPMPAFAG